MKAITIKIEQCPHDTASDLADIICWLNGYLEGKGEDCNSRWLSSSLETLRQIKIQIQNAEPNPT